MTLFEIIILFLIYTFCLAFSCEILFKTKCSKFERFLLFLLILVNAPVLTTAIIGMFVADIINKKLEK